MPRIRIDSWEEAQEQVASLLEQLNANPALALAAAANPLFALEELGYEINPQVRLEFEERLRFRPRTVVRLRELRETIFKQAGHAFDLNSSAELRKVLYDELEIAVPHQRPDRPEQLHATLPDTGPLQPQLSRTQKAEDPLEVLRGAHPIMKPLLRYRRLEASRPRLAPRNLYEEVRQGKRRLPIRDIRGRLKSTPGRR
jgi:hypothetical protein